MLISRTRYITLTMPLSIQEYKWLSANCRASRRNTAGIACGRRSIKGDAGMPLLNSCNKNQDKLWLNKPLLTSTDFTSCFARTINSGKELILFFHFVQTTATLNRLQEPSTKNNMTMQKIHTR